jgi:hypothetical protein
MKTSSRSLLIMMKIQALRRIINALKESAIYKRYFRAPQIGNHFGSLSKSEMHYVTAIAEVFYPASTDLEKKELYKTVREWTANRTEKDGYFEVYREGIATIRMITKSHGHNTVFFDLPIKKREQIIDDEDYLCPNIYDKPSVKKPFEVLRFVINGVINQSINRQSFFFSKMRHDLIRGIFSSPLGWEIVGVHPPPGTARDPLAYTKPPKDRTGER